jgi:exodeoxyribonuclease VIII
MIDQNVPAYYEAWLNNQLDEVKSEVFDLGKALHMRVLEPAKFETTYIDMDRFGDMRSSTRRAERDEFIKNNPGVVAIKQKQLDAIAKMYESLMRRPLVEAILSLGKREVVLRWVDPRTGLMCKSRVDFYDERYAFALDLKSVASASKWDFGRSMYEYGYHTQHCMYSEGCRANELPLRGFVFLLVEKTPPFLSALRKIIAPAEERGFQQFFARMDKLKAIKDSGRFMGYPDEIEDQDLPAYGYSDKVQA